MFLKQVQWTNEHGMSDIPYLHVNNTQKSHEFPTLIYVGVMFGYPRLYFAQSSPSIIEAKATEA